MLVTKGIDNVIKQLGILRDGYPGCFEQITALTNDMKAKRICIIKNSVECECKLVPKILQDTRNCGQCGFDPKIMALFEPSVQMLEKLNHANCISLSKQFGDIETDFGNALEKALKEANISPGHENNGCNDPCESENQNGNLICRIVIS